MGDRLSEIRAMMAGAAWARLDAPVRDGLLVEAKGALPVARSMAFDALAEAARLDLVRRAGLPPEACGPELPVAPAASAYRVFDVLQAYPALDDKGQETTVLRPGGFQGRKTAARADAFDRMRAQAERRKADAPFRADHVGIGRRYAALVMDYDAGGMRGSWAGIEGGRSGGSREGFTDHRLDLAREIDRLRKRIGPGMAMTLRRIRPSARGDGVVRQAISDRALVDGICVDELTVSEVLARHGWSVKTDHIAAAVTAAAAAFDRMIGWAGRHGIQVVHL